MEFSKEVDFTEFSQCEKTKKLTIILWNQQVHIWIISSVSWFHEYFSSVSILSTYSDWHLVMQIYGKMMPHSEPLFSRMAKAMNKQKNICTLDSM